MQLIELLTTADKVVITIDGLSYSFVGNEEFPTGTEFDVLFLERVGYDHQIYTNLTQEISVDSEGNFGGMFQMFTINGTEKKQFFAKAYKFVPYTA